MNIGFKDAYTLARLIANSNDVPSALIEYQKQRRVRNKLMQKLMESLHYCFVKSDKLGILKHRLLSLAGNDFVKQQILNVAI